MGAKPLGCGLENRRYDKIIAAAGEYGGYFEIPRKIAPAIQHAIDLRAPRA
jgi:hypothetical protein